MQAGGRHGWRHSDGHRNLPLRDLWAPIEPFGGRRRDTSEGAFCPDSHNPWLLLMGAEAAGPIWIGDSGRRAVHVPRGHVGDTPSQKRQRRRQGTRTEKSE